MRGIVEGVREWKEIYSEYLSFAKGKRSPVLTTRKMPMGKFIITGKLLERLVLKISLRNLVKVNLLSFSYPFQSFKLIDRKRQANSSFCCASPSLGYAINAT
jgi:hypothetical protein